MERKAEIIQMRISKSDKQLIARAARAEGRSLSSFMVYYSVCEAKNKGFSPAYKENPNQCSFKEMGVRK